MVGAADVEKTDTQQVKVYVLETRTGEMAVAVERPDGKRWRFLRNSIDFELLKLNV